MFDDNIQLTILSEIISFFPKALFTQKKLADCAYSKIDTLVNYFNVRLLEEKDRNVATFSHKKKQRGRMVILP